MPLGRDHWRGRGGSWGWDGPRGDRRPPWWPESEPWPPPPEAWRQVRRRFARRAAGFVLFGLLFLTLIGAGIVWLLSSAFGAEWQTVVGTMLVIVGFLLLARWLIRGVRTASVPLGDLIEAAGRLEAGGLGEQVPERGPGEVRSLARAFNTMSARLADTEEQRRRLLAEVSHELRTPLTVIQGNLEAMLDGVYPADSEHLERIQAEARQLERLIEDLRTLSLADAGALALEREPVDLVRLVHEAVEGFQAQAAAAEVKLAVSARVAVELELDSHRVRQVIANLVANALRHTPAGGQVTVTVEEDAGEARLVVRDTGSGMSEDDSARAFERFWRTGDAAGAGLGLAIVRGLVEAHGGTATLDSSPGQGTTVTCSFPR